MPPKKFVTRPRPRHLYVAADTIACGLRGDLAITEDLIYVTCKRCLAKAMKLKAAATVGLYRSFARCDGCDSSGCATCGRYVR